MKTIFCLSVALLAVTSARAEIFRPVAGSRVVSPRTADASVSRGGGYIPRDGRHFGSGQGGGYRDFGYRRGDRGYSRGYYRHDHGHSGFGFWGPRISYGFFPSYGYYSGYGYGYPYYDAYPYYGSYGYYGSGSAATNGFLLGALAGGVIGNNSGEFRHSAWRGSAWGAGLGWLLGSVIDANRRPTVYAPASAAPVVLQQSATTQAPVSAAQPQQVTIINNYYNSSTPMTAANGMFGR